MGLLAASGLFYGVHYIFFHDLHHIIIYLVGDIAFLPLEMLLVTLVLHKLLDFRERRERKRKRSMIMGTFFSEIGTLFLTNYKIFDEKHDALGAGLQVNNSWTGTDFQNALRLVKTHTFCIRPERIDLSAFHLSLKTKHDFLIRMMENPVLTEHENCTDLLHAVYHLHDELDLRHSLTSLSREDLSHLSGDITRVYKHFFTEWLLHLRHQQTDYPYLFSLSVRMNVFRPDPGAEIRAAAG